MRLLSCNCWSSVSVLVAPYGRSAVAFCEVFVGGGWVLAARPDCITKANTRPYCHSAARRASGYLLRLTLVHFSSKHISHILLKQGFYISWELGWCVKFGIHSLCSSVAKKIGWFSRLVSSSSFQVTSRPACSLCRGFRETKRGFRRH